MSPLQLYLDLKQLPGRAEEIAKKELQEIFVPAPLKEGNEVLQRKIPGRVLPEDFLFEL